MAERLADIVAKITNVRQLGAVVVAMRGIAASRAQQARGLLPGIEAYSGVVTEAIAQALQLVTDSGVLAAPTGPVRQAFILFCAEQGFAGAFSERVFEAAGLDGRKNPAFVFILGTRGAAIARERGIAYCWSAPMAAQTGAVTTVANRAADALYKAIAAGKVNKVDLFFPRFVAGQGIEISKRSLLPLDLSQFHPQNTDLPPMTTLAPRDLIESLAAEHVFAQLCDAAMHGFAAENEARMLAMSSAKTNIEGKLTELTRREQQLRQDEITTEIVELAAGVTASGAAQARGR